MVYIIATDSSIYIASSAVFLLLLFFFGLVASIAAGIFDGAQP
jgi:hypothetical protein